MKLTFNPNGNNIVDILTYDDKPIKLIRDEIRDNPEKLKTFESLTDVVYDYINDRIENKLHISNYDVIKLISTFENNDFKILMAGRIGFDLANNPANDEDNFKIFSEYLDKANGTPIKAIEIFNKDHYLPNEPEELNILLTTAFAFTFDKTLAKLRDEGLIKEID